MLQAAACRALSSNAYGPTALTCPVAVLGVNYTFGAACPQIQLCATPFPACVQPCLKLGDILFKVLV